MVSTHNPIFPLIPWSFIPRPLGRICLIRKLIHKIHDVLMRLIPRFRGMRKSSVSERACPVGFL